MKKCTNCGFELNDNDLFCMNCGNKIVQEERKQSQEQKSVEKKAKSSQGNQKIGVWKIASGILLASCIILGIFYGMKCEEYDDLNGAYQYVINKNADLEKQVLDMKGQNETTSELATLRNDYEKLYDEYVKTFSQMCAYEEQAEFMNDYVVIVNANSTEMVYHTYNCSLWQADDGSWSIYIYNIDAALQEGYSACAHCH